MASLLEGQGVGEVAKKTGLPKQTVSRIKTELEKSGQNGTKKSERVEALVYENLETNLVALKAIASEVSKPTYIQANPASEVAVLYGVLADKSFRILEAIANGAGP